MCNVPIDSLNSPDTRTPEHMRTAGEREADVRSRDRGNVLLAVALMLAALVVLVAASLTLAPTGSDGVTEQSVSGSDIDTVEQGLEVVFVESNDTLDPDYQPVFDPPETEDPDPIDYDTVEELLETEPFTREQVVQTQSLMASLAHRSMGGTIASLEPVSNDTRNGVLVRLGNDEAHDFGGDETLLVENATAVRDIEILLERETLPFTPENATTVQVGDWTLAAYQNVDANSVHYQLGEHDPGGEWHQTNEGEDLHINVHESSINGEPVEDGKLDIDPGPAPFDVVVADTRWGGVPPEFPGTHGGVNLVAVGAKPDDVGDVASEDWQEVVTRAVLDVTYIDATTTYVDRVDVDPEYTYFEYERGDSERDPRVGIDSTVETVEFGNQEGVLINNSEGAQLTTEVVYWNGTTDDVTGATEYEIPESHSGTAELEDDGNATLFVPLLDLPEDDHEVDTAYEITVQGETHTFEETLPVTVINPLSEILVNIETAEVGDSEGLLPIVQDEYEVAITGDFIDGEKRPIADHPDIDIELDGSEYVEMSTEENVTLTPKSPTPEGEPVTTTAEFRPTEAYEGPTTEPLVVGNDSAPVADPVQNITVGVENETQPLPLDVEDYVVVGNTYGVTTGFGLSNGTVLEMSGSEWVTYDFLPPHKSDPPASLDETGADVELDPHEPTEPDTQLTLEGTYTFDGELSDTDSVAVLDIAPTELLVDIHSEQLNIAATSNTSVEVLYEAAGEWPDEIPVEPTPGAIESCDTDYPLSVDCGETPYQVTGQFHGVGTLNVTVDEAAVLGITGENLTDSDSVAVGFGDGVPGEIDGLPPHRARLDAFEDMDDPNPPNGTHRAQTAEFDMEDEELIDPGDPFGWMETHITVYDNQTAEVRADRPTEIRALANMEAADAYDLGNRSVPPYLTGDFTGGSDCTAGCWELTDVSFDGEYDPADPFHGPDFRTEAFVPREAGRFDVTASVTYLEVPDAVKTKYQNAGMGGIVSGGTMSVPILGDFDYNVTVNDEVLYGRGEANLFDSEVVVTGDNSAQVSTDLENVGNRTGLFDVTFEILETGQSQLDTEYKLEPNETASGQYQGVPNAYFSSLLPDEYTAKISTRNGSAEREIEFEIEDPGEPDPSLSSLNIAGQGDDATIDEGDDEDVTVQVENVGDDAGSFEIELEIGGGTVSRTQTTDVLGPGGTETVTFVGVTSSLDADEDHYEVITSTDDHGFDATIGTLTVESDNGCSEEPCPV